MNALKTTLLSVVLLLSITIKAQLVTSNTLTPQQLVQQVLLGAGVSASNITYTGHASAIAKYTAAANTNLGIPNGVLMTSGRAVGTAGVPGNVSASASTDNLLPGDSDLDNVIPNTQDACILEFDFIPQGDTLSFNYVFGSDEYPTYVCSQYADMFAYLVSGPNPAGGMYANQNIATIPGTSLPVSINSINSGSPGSSYPASGCLSTAFSSLFKNNQSPANSFIKYNGMSKVLKAKIPVICGQTYHIKMGIADVIDGTLDSGVFLEAGSFSSAPPISFSASNGNSAVTDTVLYENCNTYCVKFIRNGNIALKDSFNLNVSGSAINGNDYATFTGTTTSAIAWPTKIVFQANQDTFKVCGISILEDNMVEGLDSIVYNLTSFNTSTASCLSTNSIEFKAFLGDQKSLTLAITNATVCVGQTTTLNATPALGLPPYTYTWMPAGSTNTIVTGPISAQQDFTVTVMDGCNEIETQTISVFPAPTPTVSVNSETVCAGNTVTLVANGAPNYSWSNNLTLNNDINVFIPVSTANYTVVGFSGSCSHSAVATVSVIGSSVSITGSNQICLGQTTTLSAMGGSNSFTWNDNSNNTTLVITPTVTTTYSVVSTLGSCTYTAEKTVTVNSTPTVTVNSATLCTGNSATLIAQTNGTVSNWIGSSSTSSTAIVSPVSTTNYTVVVANGTCTNLAVATVTAYSGSASVSGVNQVCNGESSTLAATGGDSYVWNNGAGTTTISVTPSVTTIYSVTSSVQSCTYSGVYTVTVNPIPTVSITSANICLGQTATLTAGGAATYTWSTGLNSNVLTANPTVNTTYSIIGASAFNCTNTASYTQSVITTSPKIDVISAQLICLDSLKTIPVVVSGGTTPYNITWHIPTDGLIPYDTISNNYYVKATTEGTHTYSINVKDFCNLKDSTIFDITVHNCTVIVPNVITLNNDGVNDVFKINGLQFFSNSRVNVFNRWGKQVYTNADYKNDWKPELTTGTYFYVVELSDGRKFNGFMEIIN